MMKEISMINRADKKKNIETYDLYIEALVCIVLFAALYMWARVQPLYDQPDEWCRFLLPYYVMQTGKLPNGNLPSLMISTYGISYAYFPGLPYIFMGIFMKLASFFGDSAYHLLMAARMVNILAGVTTFIVLRRLARLAFKGRIIGWFFSLVGVLWPQVMFIFTYVNCDGFAYLSCAVIMYALVRGLTNKWTMKDIVILSLGISLCLLSYFNAYGMVVGAFITFVLSFITVNDTKRYSFDIKTCIRKGLMVCLFVAIFAGWWFIRSAILYEGDFIGLEANRRLAQAYAAPAFKPSMKVTIQSLGYPITYLLQNQDYMFLVKQSFFGRFGNMVLPASNFVLRGYKLILTAGIALTIISTILLIVKKIGIKGRAYKLGGLEVIYLWTGALISSFIAAFLCVWYSYTSDYQPQGRYILPGLIPLLFVVFAGYGRLADSYKGLGIQDRRLVKAIEIIVILGALAYLILALISCIMTIYGAYYGDYNLTRALIFDTNF